MLNALQLLSALLVSTPLLAAVDEKPDFQRFIFWAYGLACLLLFVATVWLIAHSRRLAARLDYLEDRFRKAHPDAAEATQSET